ncbi:hypothetical protein PV328_001659 [Microctonus aethiopoides]|uniref:Uncharacterized protein n=1 Tax=Microctonus aethiopoides TaxID=144406 RepID=A0AA39KXQ9_9HYME|nr:hypothetical protein PV328_001659 [Microctonus aethiopoides]
MKAIIVIQILAILLLINFALSLRKFPKVLISNGVNNPSVHRVGIMKPLESLDTEGLIDTMSIGNLQQSRLQKRSSANRKVFVEVGKLIGESLINSWKESSRFIQTPDLKDAKIYMTDENPLPKMTGYQLHILMKGIKSGKFKKMLQKKEKI